MMAAILLDTSVASLLHPKRQNSAQRLLYEPHLRRRILAVSFQTVAELYQWAEQYHWGTASRAELDQFLSRFFTVRYDRELARVWARVMTEARARGRRLEAADAWIASSAIRHSIPLLTQDRDLAGLKLAGLKLISYAS